MPTITRKTNLQVKQEIKEKELERKNLSKYILRLKNLLRLRTKQKKDYDINLDKII